MEALAGTAASSILPVRHPPSRLTPHSLALRGSRCGPLRAAGGGKDEVKGAPAANGSPVLKLKSDASQNGVLPIAADKAQKASSTNPGADSSGTRAGLFRTPISGGVQSATFAHGLPPPALAVRNLMEQARFAHLCSVMSGMHHRRTGYPFGSLVDFANDSMGHPIFSLSPLAIHTRNLLSDPRCTLVVQEWAHKEYVAKHQQWSSQQWGNFYYYRMQNISDIYFIGGFGTVAWVDVKEYETIQPDKVAVDGAKQSLKELNAIFSKPLREFLSSEGEVDDAAVISVDSKGIDIRVRQGAQFNIQRLAFDVPHKVETLEEAKKALHRTIKTISQ
nr:unnamed protein product [Digitaria exilis]